MFNHNLFFNCAQLSDNKFYCLSLKQTYYLKRKPTVISSGVAKGGLGVVNPQQVPSPRSPPLDSHQVKNVYKYIMILHLIINPHEMVEPPPPPPQKKSSGYATGYLTSLQSRLENFLISRTLSGMAVDKNF